MMRSNQKISRVQNDRLDQDYNNLMKERREIQSSGVYRNNVNASRSNFGNPVPDNQGLSASRPRKNLNSAQWAQIKEFQNNIANTLNSFQQQNKFLLNKIEQVRRMGQLQRRKSDFIQKQLQMLTGKNYSNNPNQKVSPNVQHGFPMQAPIQPFNEIVNQSPMKNQHVNSAQRPQINLNELLSRIAEAEKKALFYKAETQKIKQQIAMKSDLLNSPDLAALFQQCEQLKANAAKLITKKNSSNQNYNPPAQRSRAQYDIGKFDKYDSGSFNVKSPNYSYKSGNQSILAQMKRLI